MTDNLMAPYRRERLELKAGDRVNTPQGKGTFVKDAPYPFEWDVRLDNGLTVPFSYADNITLL